MCIVITEILPESINPIVYNNCFAPLHRKLRPVMNPSILNQIGSGYRYYCGCAASCDCGTIVGSIRPGETTEDLLEREKKKLRKKQWTEHKIQSWIDTRQRLAEQRGESREDEARRWLECIHAYLESTHGKRLGLLVHWYNGPLEEDIILKGMEEHHIADLTPENLYTLKEDYINWFKR